MSSPLSIIEATKTLDEFWEGFSYYKFVDRDFKAFVFRMWQDIEKNEILLNIFKERLYYFQTCKNSKEYEECYETLVKTTKEIMELTDEKDVIAVELNIEKYSHKYFPFPFRLYNEYSPDGERPDTNIVERGKPYSFFWKCAQDGDRFYKLLDNPLRVHNILNEPFLTLTNAFRGQWRKIEIFAQMIGNMIPPEKIPMFESLNNVFEKHYEKMKDMVNNTPKNQNIFEFELFFAIVLEYSREEELEVPFSEIEKKWMRHWHEKIRPEEIDNRIYRCEEKIKIARNLVFSSLKRVIKELKRSLMSSSLLDPHNEVPSLESNSPENIDSSEIPPLNLQQKDFQQNHSITSYQFSKFIVRVQKDNEENILFIEKQNEEEPGSFVKIKLNLNQKRIFELLLDPSKYGVKIKEILEYIKEKAGKREQLSKSTVQNYISAIPTIFSLKKGEKFVIFNPESQKYSFCDSPKKM
ncbi:MAG: hypothetical protein WCJ84_04600 [Candidatus Peregrinibacteria bacterium]